MPPFCAPSPASLLSEPPSMNPPPPPAEDDDRTRMISSLVSALSDAETGAGLQRNADSRENQHQLATQAYASLCFDFPIVPTNGLAALASVLRTSPLDIGTPTFPMTERLTSGLRYLVSIEFTNKSALDGPVVPTQDLDAGGDDETFSDSKSRCQHLLVVCGCVFFLAPALRLALVHEDNGASLREFLATFDPSAVDPVDKDYNTEDLSTSDIGLEKILSNSSDITDVEGENQDATIHDVIAAEMDDDESDWEPLETVLPSSDTLIPGEVIFPRQEEKAGWSVLMRKLSLLSGLIPTEVINNSIWEELQLTEHLIQALQSMKTLEKKGGPADVLKTANSYAELLSDHLLLTWRTPSSELAKVLTTLLGLADASGEFKPKFFPDAATDSGCRKSWELLVLSTLAKLCSKVGGYPVRKNLNYAPTNQSVSKGNREHCSSPSPLFIRNLWLSVCSSRHFLQVQLTEALERCDSLSQLEMVFWILCFLVKCSPGNADLRGILLEGGMFRTALQLFIKVGRELQMEPLRHFLLLSMASSPSLAEFAAQVPAFKAALAEPELLVEGSYTKAHAVIWPLLLGVASRQSSMSTTPSGQSEGMIVAAFNGIIDAVAADAVETSPSSFLRELLWLHWLLLLLEEAASAYPGATFKLWQQGSSVDISIGRCQTALAAVCRNMTEESPSNSLAHKLSDNRAQELDGKIDLQDSSSEDVIISSEEPKEKKVKQSTLQKTEGTALEEKLRELVPSILLQLKQLSAHTKGSRQAKID